MGEERRPDQDRSVGPTCSDSERVSELSRLPWAVVCFVVLGLRLLLLQDHLRRTQHLQDLQGLRRSRQDRRHVSLRTDPDHAAPTREPRPRYFDHTNGAVLSDEPASALSPEHAHIGVPKRDRMAEVAPEAVRCGELA